MPDEPNRAVAKSLHTVTVIIQVAGYMHASGAAKSVAGAIASAMTVLGLNGRPDPYGLADKATAIMNKDA